MKRVLHTALPVCNCTVTQRNEHLFRRKKLQLTLTKMAFTEIKSIFCTSNRKEQGTFQMLVSELSINQQKNY